MSMVSWATLGKAVTAGQRRWFFPLLRTNGTTCVGLCSVLGFPEQDTLDTLEQILQRATKMTKRLEYMYYKEKLRELEKRRLDWINEYKYLMQGTNKVSLLLVYSERTRGSGHKLKYMEFHLNIFKIVFFFCLLEWLKMRMGNLDRFPSLLSWKFQTLTGQCPG